MDRSPYLPALKAPVPLLLPITALIALSACRKDELFTDEPVQLDFSRDTVLFDTVFTTLTTSVTKYITARNTGENAVRVDIELEGGTPSPYRINVDGSSGTSFQDVEILGGDSIYLFVEVLPGAGGVNTPFIIEDHILFNTNGAEQSVLLLGWGQDAHFYPNPDRPIQHVQGFPPFSYIAGGFDPMGNQICGEVIEWFDDKPYVIYSYGVVDSCNALVIHEGVRVHFHGGGGLWVYRHGRIEAQGTVDDRITFQGDRLEPLYDDLPGQWDRIWINEGADTANRFINVEIKNALIGIQCEPVPWEPTLPTSGRKLVLNNVSIRNCSAAGILSRNYAITSNNLLVGDCGQYGVALTGGGRYYFNHSTIGNYWAWDVRQTPAFVMTNRFEDPTGAVQVRAIESGEFLNGIIYGSNTNEFELDLDAGQPTDFTFHHWLFRTDQSTSDTDHFPDQGSIYRNQGPGFVNPSDGDLHLAAGAFARNKGTFSNADAVEDLDGNGRPCFSDPDGAIQDLGCYEFCP